MPLHRPCCTTVTSDLDRRLHLQGVPGPLGTRLGALCWGAGSASMAAWCAAWITGTFRRYSWLCTQDEPHILFVAVASLWKALCIPPGGLQCVHDRLQGNLDAADPTVTSCCICLHTCAGAAQKRVTPKPEITFKVAVVAQGTIVDMLEDVNTGINWVMQKISHYGGDPEQVYLVGQSCGAQLCSLTTLLQVPRPLTAAFAP